MGGLPTDPRLLHVSYLTVEVLEVAGILLTKPEKEPVQHSTSEHSPAEQRRPLLQHSTAQPQPTHQRNARPVPAKPRQVLPVTGQQGCWGLSQGCPLSSHHLRTESIRAGRDAHTKNPDHSQAGYELEFCLLLVPIISVNGELLAGPTPRSQAESKSNKQCHRCSAVTATGTMVPWQTQ